MTGNCSNCSTCIFFAYFSYLGKGDGISISVWNRRKISKKSSAGFLGCLRLNPPLIHRVKDTGCKYIFIYYS